MSYYKLVVESAKSGKSSCGRCGQVIEKDIVRVQEVDTTFRHMYMQGEGASRGYGIQKWYVHLACHQPKPGCAHSSYYDAKGLKAAGKVEFKVFLEKLEENNGVNMDAPPVMLNKLTGPDMSSADVQNHKLPGWVLGGPEFASSLASGGKKGKKAAAKKKDDEDEDEDAEKKPTTKRKAPTQKKDDSEEEEEEQVKTKKKAPASKKKKDESEEEDEEEVTKSSTKRKALASKTKKKQDEEEDEEAEAPKAKKAKTTTAKKAGGKKAAAKRK